MGIYRPSTTCTSNTASEEAVLDEFAEILKSGGSEVTVVPEIQRHKFSKNFWNCVLGASAALVRYPLPSIFRPRHRDPGQDTTEPGTESTTGAGNDEPLHAATSDVPYRTPVIREHTIPFLYDALMELYTLGRVLFPPSESDPGLDPDVVKRTLKNTAVIHTRTDSTHRPSMLVDIEMGRPMELDVVIGEVVRLGREKGVPVPVGL